ncbi:hypothetical protein EDC04DRAFT_2615287 [Pisolithus marmoratus]|nr:hypothetical protein EDC04DRAFT_2615287 [Pisolithus marmoratus]
MADNNHTLDNLWKEFTEWLDMLDETSQQFMPPVVLSAASVFWEIEMFHPIEPSMIPQNMLVCESIHLFPQDPRGFHYWISRALVTLAFCELDNYAKHAAILWWTAAFEPQLFYRGLAIIHQAYYTDDEGIFMCSPYCKLDMYHTIHALHACSPPSGPHCLLSSMFQVHPTVDMSLGILMVLARAGSWNNRGLPEHGGLMRPTHL